MRRLAEQIYTRAYNETRFIPYRQTLFNKLLALICVCRVKNRAIAALLRVLRVCAFKTRSLWLCSAETTPGFFQVGGYTFHVLLMIR